MLQSFFLMRKVPILVPPFVKIATQTALGEEKGREISSPSPKKAIRRSTKKKAKTDADAG